MVYVHVPFCRSFCSYCDFYSEVACAGRDAEAIEAYAGFLCREASSRRDEILATLDVDTLYFGGGTPSVLPPSVLARILRALPADRFSEFTVEVNPEDILEKGADYVRALVDMGVDRISMGVQSFDDGILGKMHRRHTSEGARRAFGILREAGVRNISMDLIFGGFGMDCECLDRTLDILLSLGPEHVSAYQLSIEEGSALAGLAEKGLYAETPDSECVEQYALVCRRLSSAGYGHYEISNWSRAGFRAVHNSAYWKRLPYVGLGPSAHSFDGVRRSWNSCGLASWTAGSESIGPAEAREETIMLGLRTSDGIVPDVCDALTVDRLLSEGLLVRCGDAGSRVRIPEDRFFISDSIVEMLV